MGSSPHEGRISIVDEDGELYAIEIGATFLTGIEIDEGKVSRGRAAGSAAQRLRACTDVPFTSATAVQPDQGTYYAIDGHVHGSDVVPLKFAAVKSDWVLDQCDGHRHDGWRIASAECDIHDFGVGMIVLTWVPTVEAQESSAGLDDLLAGLNRATSIAVEGIVERISAACQATLASDPCRVDLTHGFDVSGSSMLPNTGSVLWLWHLLLLTTSSGNQPDLASKVASSVCPNSFELVVHRDHCFAPGVHASVACSVRGQEADALYLLDAPRLKDAWWTMYWRLDRVLLGLQVHLQRNEQSTELSELVQRAQLLREVAGRVNLWRSRLDSILVASGARDNDAWQALGRAWKMDRHVEVVDRKIALLAETYAVAIEQIREARSRRVNLMIYLFTAFSVVASSVAVAEYAQGSTDGRPAVRLAIVLLALLTTGLAMGLSLGRRAALRRNT